MLWIKINDKLNKELNKIYYSNKETGKHKNLTRLYYESYILMGECTKLERNRNTIEIKMNCIETTNNKVSINFFIVSIYFFINYYKLFCI